MNKKILILLTALCLAGMLHAQTASTALTGQRKNYISTGMPILLIAPDAVSSAMGDVGVASQPDLYSAHWNNAKYAFIEDNFGIGTTYTPWLRRLGVSDMNLLYLSAYGRINNRSAWGASLTYFSLGEIQATDIEGNNTGSMNPNEFAIDGTYAMKLSDVVSLGATARFMRSDLTNGQEVSDGSGYVTTKPAWSLAADIGFYFEQELDKSQEMAAGIFISNLGAKLSYSDDDTDKEFIPTNLRLGGRYTNRIDNYNKVTFEVDANKLLVPTPPVTEGNTTYSDYYKSMSDWRNTGVIRGALQSLYDAPGGFKEEIQEIQLGVGGEYWYNETFAARAGYFYEHANKGGRQYVSVGLGVKYNIFNIDLSYLIPTADFSTNPLTNTVRISLGVNFAKKK